MIHVVQMTDTHLFADANGKLYDTNTRDTLSAVIAHAKSQLPPIDTLLVTGDLVHDETETGYQVLRELVQPLNTQDFYLPGNHDDPHIMQRVLPNATRDGMVYVDRGSWLIVLLDSSLTGKVEGALSPATLNKLADLLSMHPQHHVLIALHHHVVDVHSPWLDALNLRNNTDFLTFLKDFSNVKLVVNGHIHQELDEQRNGIRFLGTPATCFQFAANQSDAGIDSKPPGYRQIMLHDDGGIETTVHYVEL